MKQLIILIKSVTKDCDGNTKDAYSVIAVKATDDAIEKMCAGTILKTLDKSEYCDLIEIIDGDNEVGENEIKPMGITISDQDIYSIDGAIDNMARAFANPKNKLHKYGYTFPERILFCPSLKWMEIKNPII